MSRMSLLSDQGLKMVRSATVCGLLIMAALPVWAGENHDVMSEQERAARIQDLQRQRARIESELHGIPSQPEGTARSAVPRSELSDQPTRNMKESLESLPGVSSRGGASGRDIHLSIQGSK